MPTTDRRPRARIILVAVGVLLIAATAVGVYGLVLAPRPADQPANQPAPTTPTASPSDNPAQVTEAERFARRVAAILYDWDTANQNPADVTEDLMTLADPTGQEVNGLVADIANHLPDTQTWATLRGYQTRQRLDIATVAVPDTWDQTVTDAQDQLLPGTVAYTVTGTRVRDGVWNGQPTTYSGPVSFTVFVTCAPSFPECHLMRLSLPDQPLR